MSNSGIKKCPSCTQANDRRASFCKRCGTPLASLVVERPSVFGSGSLLPILLCLFAGATITYVVWYNWSGKDDPVDVKQKYVVHVIDLTAKDPSKGTVVTDHSIINKEEWTHVKFAYATIPTFFFDGEIELRKPENPSFVRRMKPGDPFDSGWEHGRRDYEIRSISGPVSLWFKLDPEPASASTTTFSNQGLKEALKVVPSNPNQ